MINKIKIFGERNTGTNYLEQLIDLNLKIYQLRGVVPKKLRRSEWHRDMYFELTGFKNLGWKHAMPPTDRKLESVKTNTGFVTLVKNPYSWLLSLYRRPYHNEEHASTPFVEFVCRKWATVRRERTGKFFDSPVDIWNTKNRAYLEMKQRCQAINFRYEHLLSNTENIISKISDAFNIEKKQPSFLNVQESTKDNSRDFQYYKDYYLKERWRQHLDQDSLGEINDRLDQELVRELNYEIIESLT